MNFKVLIERDEDGCYVATVPALPGCISQGRTEMEANRNIKEAIELHLKCLAGDGVPLITRAGVKEVAVAVSI
ncbi:MAG: type II toxin-antitoxin system HicB family antitoxin [Euryarchaeota archaeon]|nr:type II toxin-antitoxin system HicB family antitoxin [Euryarchaeota archaeon]